MEVWNKQKLTKALTALKGAGYTVKQSYKEASATSTDNFVVFKAEKYGNAFRVKFKEGLFDRPEIPNFDQPRPSVICSFDR